MYANRKGSCKQRLRASASLRVETRATITMDEKTDGKASSRYVQVI